MKSIYDYNFSEMEELMIYQGWKKFRAKQLFEWLYRKRVKTFDDMTSINKDMRAYLKENFTLSPLTLVKNKWIVMEQLNFYLN